MARSKRFNEEEKKFIISLIGDYKPREIVEKFREHFGRVVGAQRVRNFKARYLDRIEKEKKKAKNPSIVKKYQSREERLCEFENRIVTKSADCFREMARNGVLER